MRANERMNALANNGIDTSKFFTITLDRNVVNKGIMLKLDGDDLTVSLADDYRKLREQISDNGTVACTKLYRRWICAQMLRIQKGIAEGKYRNIEDYMSHFTFKYMRRVISEELTALRAIERSGDIDTYNERSVFYTKDVIINVYTHWINDLKLELENAKIHIQNRNKWLEPKREYVVIGNRNFYVDDVRLDIADMVGILNSIRTTNEVTSVRAMVVAINNKLTKYENGRRQIYSVPSSFKETYKASGAYYTLKNLVLFHNANLVNYETAEVLDGTEAFEYLKTYLSNVDYEGYKVYALMKDCLKRNNIRLDNLF